MELAIGKYPIPPPTPDELASIFGDNAIEDHMEAAKSGKPLTGKAWTQKLSVLFMMHYSSALLN